jgi:hypothetical protein
MQMNQLELIVNLFDGIGETSVPRKGRSDLRGYRSPVHVGLQVLAVAVDVLAEKVDRLDHSTDPIDPIEIEVRFAHLNAQLAEMTKRIKKLSKNSERTGEWTPLAEDRAQDGAVPIPHCLDGTLDIVSSIG